ncbi:MAG: NnrS family protein [Anaerolineae bacterium]|nr:NnrS family protein [Anaerolineae bacterium]
MDWTRRTHEPFVYAGLLLALTAGFGYGALMVGALALNVVPGTWWAPVVQSHGHAQLFGWVGLFVLGMGLYFLPRLYGGKLQGVTRTPFALGLIVLGIILRVIVQPMLGFNPFGDSAEQLGRLLWALSAALELAGILVIGSMLRLTGKAAKPLLADSPAKAIEPFIRIALVSLFAALFVNLFGVWHAAAQGKTTVAPSFENVLITLMLYGLTIPMAIIFSTRTLPLFMRLAPPPREPLRMLAFVYAGGLVLVLLPSLFVILESVPLPSNPLQATHEQVAALLNALWGIGSLGINLAVLVFLWQLDLLRLKPARPLNRASNVRPDLVLLPKPKRANYPDTGEYGRFELLVYSAFAWLAFAVLLNLARLFGEFTGGTNIPADTARHALVVGFVTLLIFGMAVRMSPGFSRKKGVAFPSLVLVTFLLGNLAAILRVVPTLFPESELALLLWGLSGTIGWTAVAVLAVNMIATFRQPERGETKTIRVGKPEL